MILSATNNMINPLITSVILVSMTTNSILSLSEEKEVIFTIKILTYVNFNYLKILNCLILNMNLLNLLSYFNFIKFKFTNKKKTKCKNPQTPSLTHCEFLCKTSSYFHI